MRILQINSDWKWTGPAEPMLRLALALRERGHTTELACPEPPRGAHGLASEARAAGLAPQLVLPPGRGVAWPGGGREVGRLRRLLQHGRFDLIHAWHSRDHTLALRASGLRPGRRAAPIVRSYARAEAIPARPWNRWLFGPGADGLLCVSPETALRNARLRGGRAIVGAFGAVDLERFRPAAPDPRVRAALGLEPGHRVVGVVARVQRRRRFDLLLAAAAELARDDPQARLLVVGRGTHRAALAEQPAARLGLGERVIFAGYRSADYLDVIRCIDVITMLVPGSDGTCRALLEAAACGIPAVTTRRGALAEIVVDQCTGLAVDEDATSLARAWRRLLRDPARRGRMGAAARRRAESHFAPARLAEEVEALYAAALLSSPGSEGRRAPDTGLVGP